MKTLATLSLFTLFLLLSCKQSGSESTSSGAPKIEPGTCAIGKWSGLSNSTPLILKMSDEFKADFSDADLVDGLNPLEQMAKAWNTAVAPTTTLFKLPFPAATAIASTSLSTFRDGELGIYKSHQWFAGVSSNALAITQFYGIVRSDGSLGTFIDLTHADIIVNYHNFSSDFTMTANPQFSFDLPTILLHEMGHLLGLCHESYANSIMDPHYFTTQRSLKSFDTNKIKALYLNNQNYSPFSKSSSKMNAITHPVGTEIKGIVELSANGRCRHFINGQLTYEHDEKIHSRK